MLQAAELLQRAIAKEDEKGKASARRQVWLVATANCVCFCFFFPAKPAINIDSSILQYLIICLHILENVDVFGKNRTKRYDLVGGVLDPLAARGAFKVRPF